MDPLQQGNEAVQQFMKLMEENNRQGQAADLSALLWYMDGMSRQLDAALQELQEVKAQLAQENEPAVENRMQGVVTNLKNKVEWARDMLAGLREKITDFAARAVEGFEKAGTEALDKAMSATAQCAKNVLESVQDHISGMIADTKQNIENVENIGHELRSVGGHLKNAGRAIAGKETRMVDGGQEGRFQSAVLAPLRATQNLLIGMNNATLAAIGVVEDLERPAPSRNWPQATHNKPGKRLAKKPSIRQELAEKKAEVAAQSAPVPDKDRKPVEAAL